METVASYFGMIILRLYNVKASFYIERNVTLIIIIIIITIITIIAIIIIVMRSCSKHC